MNYTFLFNSLDFNAPGKFYSSYIQYCGVDVDLKLSRNSVLKEL